MSTEIVFDATARPFPVLALTSIVVVEPAVEIAVVSPLLPEIFKIALSPITKGVPVTADAVNE